jgi:hypothetical protein
MTEKFVVVKRHKRLWIDDVGTSEAIYTPPSFVNLQSREPLIALANHFTKVQSRDINAIAEFEAQHSPRKRMA